MWQSIKYSSCPQGQRGLSFRQMASEDDSGWLQQWSPMSDKREHGQVQGKLDLPSVKMLHLRVIQKVSVILQFSSQNWLLGSVSLVSFTFFPAYSSTSTGACLRPNTSSESEAKVIADVPITHPWLGHWITLCNQFWKGRGTRTGAKAAK